MTNQELITFNRMINMRLKIDTFETAALKQINSLYTEAIQDMMKEVAKNKGVTTALWTQTRQIALYEELKLMNEVMAEALSIPIAETIGETGAFSYQQMNNIVGWDGAVSGFNPVSLSPTQISQLARTQKLGGKVLKDWVGDTFKDSIDDIEKEIKKGYIKGESYKKIVSRIDKIYGGEHSKQHIESITKSYVQSMTTKAQTDVFEANSDVVKRMEWSAVMEGGNTKTGRGTCPRCMALDGQIWPVGERNRPSCPLHIRCRCMWLPITITWAEMGLDGDEMEEINRSWAIRDENRNIIEYGYTDGNYADWWKTRSMEFQNNAVGPIRAEFIRNGNINFKDIVDDEGNLILIKDLKFRKPPKKDPPKKKKKKKKPPSSSGSAAPAAPSAPEYTKAKTLEEVVTPKGTPTPSGVFLEGASKKLQKSILDGFNDSVVKYGGILNAIGWQLRRRRSLGIAARSGDYIRFQKTGSKKMPKEGIKQGEAYRQNREIRMDRMKEALRDPRRANIIEFNRQRLKELNAAKRWAVYTDIDVKDPMKAIALHEGFHNVMFTHNLQGAWDKIIKEKGVTQLQKLKVSEYGASSNVELFAEVGTAYELGIKIPRHIKEAFEEIILLMR